MLRVHIGSELVGARVMQTFAARLRTGRSLGRRPKAPRFARSPLRDVKSVRRLRKGARDSGLLGVLNLPGTATDHARGKSAVRGLVIALIVAACTAALVRLTVIPWWRGWGRRAGDAGRLPGDDLVDGATAIETRSIEIKATPAEVWPWLAQMGYGRAGWYSYDALDMNMPSADHLRSDLVELTVGDVMPTHPGGGFVVRVLDAPRALVLYSDTELVRRQEEEAKASATASGPVNIRATGAFLENAQPSDFAASWAFVLEPTPSGTTRLVERFRVRFGADDRPWLGLTMPVMGFGVFVMMRKQMLGIRDRAEGLAKGSPRPVERAAA